MKKKKTNIKYRGSSWCDECGAESYLHEKKRILNIEEVLGVMNVVQFVVIVVQLADICLYFCSEKWGQCGAIMVKILF